MTLSQSHSASTKLVCPHSGICSFKHAASATVVSVPCTMQFDISGYLPLQPRTMCQVVAFFNMLHDSSAQFSAYIPALPLCTTG